MQRQRFLHGVAYGSVYLVICVILVGLLLITPGDAIQRSLRNGQTYNIWIVAISYVVTVFITCVAYVLRLYINKTALASIPKAWVPVEKGDVADHVYRMIGAGLDRSAAIAYEARPRVEGEGEGRREQGQDGATRRPLRTKPTTAEELGAALPRLRAVWGDVEHCGWASPNSPDLPNLQYSAVVPELPSLIEGKALTMAPADPAMLELEATSFLQRPPNMSLRGYLNCLADLGIIDANKTTARFVSHYEYARFLNRPISNARFREFMHLFAEVLRAMWPLDMAAFGSPVGNDDGAHDRASPSESDIDNDAPMDTDPPRRKASSLAPQRRARTGQPGGRREARRALRSALALRRRRPWQDGSRRHHGRPATTASCSLDARIP